MWVSVYVNRRATVFWMSFSITFHIIFATGSLLQPEGHRIDCWPWTLWSCLRPGFSLSTRTQDFTLAHQGLPTVHPSCPVLACSFPSSTELNISTLAKQRLFLCQWILHVTSLKDKSKCLLINKAGTPGSPWVLKLFRKAGGIDLGILDYNRV